MNLQPRTITASLIVNLSAELKTSTEKISGRFYVSRETFRLSITNSVVVTHADGHLDIDAQYSNRLTFHGPLLAGRRAIDTVGQRPVQMLLMSAQLAVHANKTVVIPI